GRNLSGRTPLMHASGKRVRRVLLAVLIGVAAAFVPIPSFSAQHAMHVDSERVVARTFAAVGGASPVLAEHFGVSTFKMIGFSWEGPVGDGAKVRTRENGRWG